MGRPTTARRATIRGAGVLIFGMSGYAAAASERHDVTAKNIIVAADDNATDDDSAAGDDSESDGSAKMGTDEGTHVGEDQGSTPENDTDKIDQPARRNPTTGDAPDEESDDVMPPDEDEDSDQPE